MGPRRWAVEESRLGWSEKPRHGQLQWGHGDGAVEEDEAACTISLAVHEASMGPRRWSRGREVASRDDGSASLTGFNGATAMEPWKSSEPRLRPSVATVASMGPRRWSRGRADASCQILQLPPNRLQWGHGDGAVEEHDAILWSAGGGRCFNGATAMEPWKSGALPSNPGVH